MDLGCSTSFSKSLWRGALDCHCSHETLSLHVFLWNRRPHSTNGSRKWNSTTPGPRLWHSHRPAEPFGWVHWIEAVISSVTFFIITMVSVKVIMWLRYRNVSSPSAPPAAPAVGYHPQPAANPILNYVARAWPASRTSSLPNQTPTGSNEFSNNWRDLILDQVGNFRIFTFYQSQILLACQYPSIKPCIQLICCKPWLLLLSPSVSPFNHSF